MEGHTRLRAILPRIRKMALMAEDYQRLLQ
jgi:hypothetical protein